MLAELAAACTMLMYETQVRKRFVAIWKQSICEEKCIRLCFLYSQIGEFIDKDLRQGIKKSIDSRKNNITAKDDWDTVQMTVSAHLL